MNNQYPDPEHVKIVNYLTNNNGKKLQDLESGLILIKSRPNTRKDLFSWDKIPGNDNGRLIKYLSLKFGEDQFKPVNIDKVDNDNTIIVSTETNSLSLKLNHEKTMIDITIDDGRIFKYEFMVRMENDEMKTYRSKIQTVPSLKDQQYDIHCFNKNINDIVIVEVKSKSERANHKTFGQILHYLLQEETFTCPWDLDVNRVRGIVLAKKIESSLIELVKRYEKATPKIDLKEYDWGVEGNLIIKDV